MKQLRRALPLLLCALLLTGCAYSGAEELYSLPRRSDVYLGLQQAIEDAMGGGGYAAPLSGANQRAIQEADLDGDGTDEMLVFARTDGEKPLKIHVLRQSGEDYALLCTIEGDGAAFDSVQYVQIDGNPGLELVVSRRLTEQVLQSVNVYSLREDRALELLGTGCTAYTLADLDGDELTDLVTFSAAADRSNGIAEYFRWGDDELRREGEADLSANAESIKRIIVGNVSERVRAVLAASTYDDSNIITDVYAVVSGVFRNLSQSDESGLSTSTVRSYYVYSADIDGDGVIELPTTEPLTAIEGEPASEGQSCVVWHKLGVDGARSESCTTYHNYAEGWYLILDESWRAGLCVTRREDEELGTGTCLLRLRGGKTDAYLTVYLLEGSDATERLDRGELVLLARRGELYYCAVIGTACSIDSSKLQSSFGFITTDTAS